MGVPVLVEVLESGQNANLQVCRKIMALLIKQKIAPLPFATNIDEVAGVLHNLKDKGLSPAIFIINTYWAEEVLRDLDAMVGDTPILLLHRQIYAGMNGENGTLTLPFQDMDSRQIAICRYGAKTTDSLAERVAAQVQIFLKGGDFHQIALLGR
ncbi:MAG TPA: hypothetical protein VGP72_13910 [Planctomycetota bacterium]|jgi:hypothetical protein